MISILPLLLLSATQPDPQLTRCAEVLKHHEGLSLVQYTCPAGHLTVGYGHKLGPGESIPHITHEGASKLLLFDTAKARDSARKVYDPIYDTLPPNAQDALLHMAYQLGETGLSRFVNLKQAITKKNWAKAAQECLDSRWHRQTPKRSSYCAALFLSCNR